MPSIDQGKLRRYHRDARDSHAALLAASSSVRRCREDVAGAKATMDSAQRATPGIKAEQIPEVPEDMSKLTTNERIHLVGNKATLRDAAAAVKALEATLARALDHEEEVRERWEHANGLWLRCRDFAAANGALPDDLRD